MQPAAQQKKSEESSEQDKKIQALTRELAQQTRELAEQKAESVRLSQQFGDMNTLQIIQAAKKSQKKAVGGGKKTGGAKRKPASTTTKDAGGAAKKRAAEKKQTPPSDAENRAPSSASKKAALAAKRDAAKKKWLEQSSSSDSSPATSSVDRTPKPPTPKPPTPKPPPPKVRRELCDTCACNFKTCQHDNYDTGYFKEENVTYFYTSAKYGGCKCCGCSRMLVLPAGKKDSIEWSIYSEENIYIIVNRKDGVHMCNNCTGNGNCRHMFCNECFNSKLGLTGAECQYTEAIGVGARMRSRRTCASS